ncbi:hypothetical protein M8J76_016190 [Diaphorina citri]|nr:hypothetical protein M8J76_016190 [Diaphorina citri]
MESISPNLTMTVANKKVELPHLTSVDRIFKIPLVDSGYHIVTILYGKVKYTNGLVTWGFTTAEKSLYTAIDLTKPTVALFEQPILIMDNLLCKSLDVVEQKVPVINYSPEVIYHLTKDYASRNVFQPMIKRAESVKEISYNKANEAAVKLDSVLNIADKYVDKYLPDDGSQDTNDSAVVPADSSNAKKTITHIKKFRHKLQKRLTQRAIIEAKALKRQGADTLQAIMYMADLLARDPKRFFQKVKELWAYLSADEPENQAPPHNLEELIVMLTRESSRRIVHLVNYTSGLVMHRMDVVQHYLQEISHFIYIQVRKSADVGAKQSALAIEQSKKVAEIAIQRSNDLLVMLYRSGLHKYKEINQILDEFVQHALKLIERLSQHQSRQHQQQNTSPNKAITPPPTTDNKHHEHKAHEHKSEATNNGQPKTKTPEHQKHHKKAHHSPSSPHNHQKEHNNGRLSPQNGQANGSS